MSLLTDSQSEMAKVDAVNRASTNLHTRDQKCMEKQNLVNGRSTLTIKLCIKRLKLLQMAS